MLKQCQCKPIAASSFVCTEGTSLAQAEAKGYERPTGRVRKPVVGSRDPCFDIYIYIRIAGQTPGAHVSLEPLL